jgi:hypothetical protein
VRFAVGPKAWNVGRKEVCIKKYCRLGTSSCIADKHFLSYFFKKNLNQEEMTLFGFLPTVRIAEKSFQEAATGHAHNLRDLVHCRTLVAVAERFRGVGCSLITSLIETQKKTGVKRDTNRFAPTSYTVTNVFLGKLKGCSATAPVSHPSSLRNSPNGSQGHPWLHLPPSPHPVPSRVKQCSTRCRFIQL